MAFHLQVAVLNWSWEMAKAVQLHISELNLMVNGCNEYGCDRLPSEFDWNEVKVFEGSRGLSWINRVCLFLIKRSETAAREWRRIRNPSDYVL